jgi:YfiH family protein
LLDSGWGFKDVGGIRFLTSAALDALPRIAHAFSTRVAFGDTAFDLGGSADDGDEMRSRRTAFMRAAGLGEAQPAILRQVHGSEIVTLSDAAQPAVPADGAIRDAGRGPATPVPAVRTADCVPVLIADRQGRAVSALHAGWRGTAASIGARAVTRLSAQGVNPRDLVIALGPAIGPCCYEVGAEVVTAVAAACGDGSDVVSRTSGRQVVDLRAALRRQLVEAGVPAGSIESAPWCTRCRADLFFSFRGEGPGTGRLMAVIGPRAGP